MSYQQRPVQQGVTVCDLCDEIVPDGQPDETASVTAGYLAHPFTPKTKRAWLLWPPPSRKRGADVRRRIADPQQFRDRRYDFHAECLLRLVEAAIAERAGADV